MQPQVGVDSPRIRIGINVMLNALHCVCVGHEVLNNDDGQHGLEVPKANL